ITVWMAVERRKALYDPALWYDSVYALIFTTKHGGEFMVLTLHLWGNVFAVTALAWARRRTTPMMSVNGLLLLIVGFSLLFTSIRWFQSETDPFFHPYSRVRNRMTGQMMAYQPSF